MTARSANAEAEAKLLGEDEAEGTAPSAESTAGTGMQVMTGGGDGFSGKHSPPLGLFWHMLLGGQVWGIIFGDCGKYGAI